MGAPLHVWAQLALLLILVAGAMLTVVAANAVHAREPYRGRHVHPPIAFAIGRASVPIANRVGARMHTFAMTPGVVHKATCLSLRGRVAPPWPWADGKTYAQIKAEMKRNHTTGCALCRPLSTRGQA